jgi:hypothetical protein
VFWEDGLVTGSIILKAVHAGRHCIKIRTGALIGWLAALTLGSWLHNLSQTLFTVYIARQPTQWVFLQRKQF